MARGRDVIDNHISNYAFLRDQHIDQKGQEVSVAVPDAQTTDQYGDRTSPTYTSSLMRIIFDWSEYDLLLSFASTSEEARLVPLTAYAKLTDVIPVGSQITIERLAPDNTLEQDIFRVATNNVLTNNRHHSRKLTLLQLRGDYY